MSIIDTDTITQQRDALRHALADLDRPDLDALGDRLGDAVSTVVVTGEHGIVEVVRSARRHPRQTVAVVAIVVAVALLVAWKRRRADDTTPSSDAYV